MNTIYEHFEGISLNQINVILNVYTRRCNCGGDDSLDCSGHPAFDILPQALCQPWEISMKKGIVRINQVEYLFALNQKNQMILYNFWLRFFQRRIRSFCKRRRFYKSLAYLQKREIGVY